MLRRYLAGTAPGGPAQRTDLQRLNGCGSRLYVAPAGNVTGITLTLVRAPARPGDGAPIVLTGNRLDLAVTVGLPVDAKTVAVWVDHQGGPGSFVELIHDDGDPCDPCEG